ncbi:hypothetical protein [Nitrosomonas ureae]|uniref:Transposase DDE domain-containing protein n=1 Tax=Nitrosomonas ureae TaxID=44577 RepID=A0A1H5XVT1_9PROT|nr:hypothetical protein [Nitrosomonas ureae]SEG15635.1 hypothetical protein SAMN05216334_13228 [Nitrosomonas ureae]
MELNTKLHLAVDGVGMPIRVVYARYHNGLCIIFRLIEEVTAEYLLVDHGYDSDTI